MNEQLDLIAFMRARFASSRQLLKCSIFCNTLVVALSLSIILDAWRPTDILVPALALLIQFGADALHRLSVLQFSDASSVQSMVFVRDCLNLSVSESRLRSFRRPWHAISVQSLPPLTAYYAPQLPPGPTTLLHVLGDTLVYTERVARQSDRLLSAITVVNSLGVVSLIALNVMTFGTRSTQADVNMLILVLFSIGAILDLASILTRYRELQDDCSRLHAECVELQKAGLNRLDETMNLVNEYNCILVTSGPLAIRFHQKIQAHLNKSWPAQSRLEYQQ